MVARYEIEEMSRNPFESYRCLEENDEGDWVKYEDYMALLECHLQTCNKLGRAAEALLAEDKSELRKALLE